MKLTAASVEGDPKSPQLPVEGRANVGSDQPTPDKHWNKSIEPETNMEHLQSDIYRVFFSLKG